MKKIFMLIFGILIVFPIGAQSEFAIKSNKRAVTIPFKLINNLIFIPIKVNGISLNFLLDSGVEETILFSMDEQKDVQFNNVEKIKLRGLGSDEEIEGLKSDHNILQAHGLISKNHLLYVILDQSFNLSSHIGIPVNGIIGYNFFARNMIEIDYIKRRIKVRESNSKNRKKTQKGYEEITITIEKFKPYLVASAQVEEDTIPSKLLIDLGNSDSFWIFENNKIKLPSKNFSDYLGKGFSGDIEGHRAILPQFRLGKFIFKNPIVAFPDSNSIKNVRMVQHRIGSVGGEIFKRFKIILDYPNSRLYLKSNRHLQDPFTYNKSGITVQQNGIQWVQETFKLETVKLVSTVSDVGIQNDASKDFKYKFAMKPIYEIASIRKNSAAFDAGLQVGDILIKINSIKSHNATLEEINELFKSNLESYITMEISRGGKILNFKFKLKDELIR